MSRLGLINEGLKPAVLSGAVSGANTVLTPTSVLMQNFDFLTFLIQFGTITDGALASVHFQQSINNTDWTDLEGTKKLITDGDSGKLMVMELIRPQTTLGDYIRLYIDRGSVSAKTVAIAGIILIYGNGRTAPYADDATIVAAGSDYYNSPNAGTP